MHFHSLEETVENLRTRDCEIIGIEITPNARPVDEHPFESSAAFIVGNEGEGLIDRQRQYCDRFVYIPQFGSAVSLNVNLAAGIVLHRYACWAGYAESPRQGEKFRDPTGGDLDCRVAEKETPRT